MKLRFLCANHRQWLHSQPDQAMHWCANSFETGWHLSQGENWKEALAHMGCAFETAEILMTTRGIAPARAVEWFLKTLDGLLLALKKLHLVDNCIELYQVAVNRLRQEAHGKLSPELEANLYLHITRLNQARRRLDEDRLMPAPVVALREVQRGDRVLH